MNKTIVTTITCAFLTLNSCMGQKNNKIMDKKEKSELGCDLETGICEVKGGTPSSASSQQVAQAFNKPVKIIYFTDPICSSCWGIEPQLKLLKLHYGAQVEIEYRMGGLLPGWDNYNGGGIQSPADVAVHWEEAGKYYEMPIDGDVWKENPLSSSFPPSIAFKAAELQDKEKALLLMRKMREMVFMEKKNIAEWSEIEAAAKAVQLDITQLKKDYNDTAKSLFEEDLKLSRNMGVRGFPTLIFVNDQQESLRLYGSRPFQDFEQVLHTLYPTINKEKFDPEAAVLFKTFGTLTTKEFASLSNLSMQKALPLLKELEQQGKIRKKDSKNGPLWIAK